MRGTLVHPAPLLPFHRQRSPPALEMSYCRRPCSVSSLVMMSSVVMMVLMVPWVFPLHGVLYFVQQQGVLARHPAESVLREQVAVLPPALTEVEAEYQSLPPRIYSRVTRVLVEVGLRPTFRSQRLA